MQCKKSQAIPTRPLNQEDQPGRPRRSFDDILDNPVYLSRGSNGAITSPALVHVLQIRGCRIDVCCQQVESPVRGILVSICTFKW